MVFKKPDSNEFDLQKSNRGRAPVPYLILTNKKAKGYLNPLQVAQITPEQRKKLNKSKESAKGLKEDV
jgi:hypothetical protein